MTRVAAITGASAGIGRATALRLARDGAAVAICARRSERLEAVAREIRDAGGQALPIVADVVNHDDMEKLVAQTVSAYGRLDVMVCNAGFGIYGPIDQVSSDQMRAVMEVNYLGTYHAARAALPIFRRQQSGHLIIVSSIVGKRGIAYMGPYSATKFAQVGLAESLRAEFAGSAIHVSIVYPISTDTEFFGVMVQHSGAATRANGPRQQASHVADAIARAVTHPTAEIYPYRPSRGLAIANALAPGWCDLLVRRWKRQPIERS